MILKSLLLGLTKSLTHPGCLAPLSLIYHQPSLQTLDLIKLFFNIINHFVLWCLLLQQLVTGSQHDLLVQSVVLTDYDRFSEYLLAERFPRRVALNEPLSADFWLRECRESASLLAQSYHVIREASVVETQGFISCSACMTDFNRNVMSQVCRFATVLASNVGWFLRSVLIRLLTLT